MVPWITQAGSYAVESIPCPRGSLKVDLDKPRAGVLHTTEGSWNSAMSVFKAHYAPHFLVGQHPDGSGRIAQLVPLGYSAYALENREGGSETNSWAAAQIEVCGFSKTVPYRFDSETEDALASLMSALKKVAGIPLTRPFPDAMPPTPWATPYFPRRNAGLWGKTAGWFGHVELPENSHWDPGALLWSPVLSHARNVLDVDVTAKQKRLATLQGWIAARRAEHWTWPHIKATHNWAEYKRLGGK
jgi:hypothetical protein